MKAKPNQKVKCINMSGTANPLFYPNLPVVGEIYTIREIAPNGKIWLKEIVNPKTHEHEEGTFSLNRFVDFETGELLEQDEIEQIKLRLDRIEKYLSETTGGANVSQGKSAIQYDLVNFEVQKSQGLIGPEYAFKLTVCNKSEAIARFIGKIIFLDNNEFEVESQITDVFTVAAGTTFTKTGKAVIIDKNHAPRIVNVTAEVYPT